MRLIEAADYSGAALPPAEGLAMDVDAAVQQAQKEYDAGNYRRGVELLLPFVRPGARKKLSPQQERDVVVCMAACFRFLGDHRAALPHAQRLVELAQQLDGPRSFDHALALEVLCAVHTGLEDFPAARAAITQALAILDERGLQQEKQYGSMLEVLGDVDRAHGRPKEALAVYERARAVLVQHKESNDYGLLLNGMAFCHQELHQWNEAVACLKEAVERARNLHGPDHPQYATALWNLAGLYHDLKQYEEAIPRMEEVLAIYQRVYGPQHERTVFVARTLAHVRQLAQQAARNTIDVGHAHRMCNACGVVKEHMETCVGCARAWYCDAACQLQHWPTHKPLCNVCLQCERVLEKRLYCSRCKAAKYCGAECQHAHWPEHKKECTVKK